MTLLGKVLSHDGQPLVSAAVTSIVENLDLVAAAPTQAEVMDGLLDAGQLEVT